MTDPAGTRAMPTMAERTERPRPCAAAVLTTGASTAIVWLLIEI